MKKSPNIKERCRDRLMELPSKSEASRDDRIRILSANIQIMREELGYIPPLYPQSEAEVSEWISDHDQTTDRLSACIEAISKMRVDSSLP